MIERTHEIETMDGRMEGFAVHPDGQGPFPAVILYMDAPGIREELRDFSRRIATEGYFVLLPDMYYRLGRLRFDLAAGDEERKRMFSAMESLSNELVVRDTRGMLSFLDEQPQVAAGPKGCIGYCMSGQYVVSAAGSFPEDFAAAASLYGVGIVTDEDDSPHLLADRIQAELYLGFAETDPWVPDTVPLEMIAALDKHEVRYRIDTWPGTEHGFCFPERDVYVKDAAERVWERVFELYARRLG